MAHTAARVGCVRLLGRLAVTGLGRLDAGHLARPRRRGRGLYRGSRALTCLGAGALPRRRAADIHQRPMPISFISRLIKGAFETALCPADELLIYTICATIYAAIRAVGAGALPPRRVAAPHHRCPPPPHAPRTRTHSGRCWMYGGAWRMPRRRRGASASRAAQLRWSHPSRAGGPPSHATLAGATIRVQGPDHGPEGVLATRDSGVRSRT